MDPYVRFDENLSLVKFVYNRKFYFYSNHQEDLLQEGYMALWKSCQSFDENQGIQFCTYAYTSIYRSMLNYVQRTIHKHNSVISLNSVVSEDDEGNVLYLEDTLSENPDNLVKYAIQEALLKISGRDKSIIEKLLEGYTQDQISKHLAISQASVSRCLQKFKNILLEELQ